MGGHPGWAAVRVPLVLPSSSPSHLFIHPFIHPFISSFPLWPLMLEDLGSPKLLSPRLIPQKPPGWGGESKGQRRIQGCDAHCLLWLLRHYGVH